MPWWLSLISRLSLVIVTTLTNLASAQSEPAADDLVHEYIEQVEWVYPEGARSRVRGLQSLLPSAWQRTAGELGLSQPPKLSIRVARNPDEMQAMAPPRTKLPSYAIGVALPAQQIVLLSLTAPKTWEFTDLETTFIHELSHIALHQAVGGHPVPRWFSEGLAIDQAQERSLSRIQRLWEATIRGELVPLSELPKAFAAHGGQVDTAYAQSADFVAFMRDGDDDRQRFRALIEALAGGASFDEAVVATYHVPLGYLERDWRNRLQARYGRMPLLLTSLTLLWVLGAVLLVVGYVRKRRKDRVTLRRWADEELRAATARIAAAKAEASEDGIPVLTSYASVRVRHDSEIPTVEYDGENYTLH